ncbi:MAG: CHRD domain-containing protein [Rubrivivax sp.]
MVLAGALAAPAQAEVILYEATLSGLQEASPNTSEGAGSVGVTIDTDDSTMRVQATFSDLTGTTTAAHIHCCAPIGVNASVATTTPTFLGFPSGVTSGTYDATFDMTLASSYRSGFIDDHGGTTALAFAALLEGLDDGLAYFNLHTSAFPGGEIRGQLSLVREPVAVPEPASAALVLAGLALLLSSRRRQPRR